MRSLDRRGFIRRAAGVAGGTLIPGSVAGLVAACSESDPPGALQMRAKPLLNAERGEGGYGPLDVATTELLLPRGFRQVPFGVVGDPMTDGNRTPIAHDGMAAFPAGRGRVSPVRNHEDRNGPIGQPIGGAAHAYDPAAGGGTTTLEVWIDEDRDDDDRDRHNRYRGDADDWDDRDRHGDDDDGDDGDRIARERFGCCRTS